MNSRVRWSVNLKNASVLVYIVWLMLPAVQVRLKAVTGGLTLAVFAVGVLLDGETLRLRWREFIPRVVGVALLPLLLVLYMERGGEEPYGYIAQQVMFWFPLLWFAHARKMKGKAAYRLIFAVMLGTFVLTTLTTIGWLIEGMVREEGKIYVYARSLGYGAADPAYLNQLMGRNIGGYGFVYASVLALPFTFYLTGGKGWRRWAFSALYVLQLIMIVLSQYTYAMVFAAAITAMELLALALRAVCKRITVGRSLLYTIPVFALVFLLRIPLVTGLKALAEGWNFTNVSFSLGQLLDALKGAGEETLRLNNYATSWQSFLASPMIGAIIKGPAKLGMHTELLDMLGALGVIGTTAFLTAIWLIGRGGAKDIKGNPALPHLVLQWAALIVFAAVNTVFYSREIPLVLCVCVAFAVWTQRPKSGIIEPR